MTTSTENAISIDAHGCRALLPHRDVMALVDGVESYNFEARRLVAIKRVPTSEFTVRGYFPRKPMFPPTMVVEALAQAGGLMMNVEKLVELHDIDVDRLGEHDYIAQLPEVPLSVLAESTVKQHTQVFPGDTLKLEAKIALQRKEFRYFKIAAHVEDKIVADGSMLLSYPDFFAE